MGTFESSDPVNVRLESFSSLCHGYVVLPTPSFYALQIMEHKPSVLSCLAL